MIKKWIFVATVLLSSACGLANAGPNSIDILVTRSQADSIVDMDRVRGSHIEIFYVDDKQRIMDAVNNSFPMDLMEKMTEDERAEWAAHNFHDYFVANMPAIQESSIGVSLMQLHKIDRVPAIIFDREYIVIGLPLSKALQEYRGAVNAQ